MVSLEYETATGGTVIGIDEAGRGPLAGGVYAAAVSVPLDFAARLLEADWSGINDSKQLSAKRRVALAEVIKATPGCTWAVASASPAEIDRLNILRATWLAMRRAACAVGAELRAKGEEGRAVDADCPTPFTLHPSPFTLRPSPPTILVDGNPVKGLPYPSRSIVKGDAKSLFIAAASILAKTARDADCERLERDYPGYGFAQHKGYPTKAHLAALARLGPCPEHRRSFGPVAQLELPLTNENSV